MLNSKAASCCNSRGCLNRIWSKEELKELSWLHKKKWPMLSSHPSLSSSIVHSVQLSTVMGAGGLKKSRRLRGFDLTTT